MKTLVAITIFVVGFALYFFIFQTTPITQYPPKNSVVVAFGDSLVFGQGATAGKDFVSVLSTLYGKQIVNLGVPGDTTTDGLARTDEVLKKDPGLVILLLGGNDFLKRVPEATIEANLSTLIERFQAHGAVVVLLGVRSGLLSNNGEAMYERLHKKYGTIYMPDVLKGIYLKQNLMSDGIHPNDTGYAIIAERLYTVLKKHKL